MEARKVRDAEDARRCLDAVRRSGLPRAVWARAQGVDARSLNAWRLALERRPRGAPLRMVELVAAEAPCTSSYRVRFGGFEVEVPSDFNGEQLAQLLRVVASC